MTSSKTGVKKKESPATASFNDSDQTTTCNRQCSNDYILQKHPDLSYLIDSLDEILQLDIVVRGDLIVTDDVGIVVFVRSNNFLSQSVLNPGVTLSSDSIGKNAVGHVIETHVASVVTAEEHEWEPLKKLNTLAVPVMKQDRLIGCVGFATSYDSPSSVITVARTTIETAILASSKMVEARRTIEELYILREFYQNLDNSIGVMMLDRNYRVLQTNREAEFILGLDRSDLCGRFLPDMIMGECELFTESTNEQEVEFRTNYGRVKARVKMQPILHTDSTHLGWRLNLEDTDQENLCPATPRLCEFNHIVGRNAKFMRLIKLARSIARSPSNVLVTGESGTGKELFAQAVHCASSYSKGPFVAINCAAIPSELIETELFGYAEGAFTGAKKQGYQGKFVQADGGTLFLDEIGDMPLELQSKLLRVLQERVVVPVGGTKAIPVDIRIISATNQNLEGMIREKRFRADLFYRLNVISLKIPPLRERKDDIPLLVEHFLNIHAKRLGKENCSITEEALEVLQGYNWPGNVRELENVVEMTVNIADQVIDVEHLPDRITNCKSSPEVEDGGGEVLPLDEIEKREILKALKAYEGNISQAAEALNIGRTTLYRKIKKYNLVLLVEVGEGM